jgi:hypothetical protein
MNLNEMTVSQLREIAATLSVPGRSKMKKADLIGAVEAAQIAARSVELFEQADAEAGELLDAALGEYVQPVASQGTVAITKYSANEAIATAAFDFDSIGGRVTRERGRWVLRQAGLSPIRAKTLSKIAKLWANKLGFYATAIDIDIMS